MRYSYLLVNVNYNYCFRDTKLNSHVEQQSSLDSIPELSQVLQNPICQVSISYNSSGLTFINLIFI